MRALLLGLFILPCTVLANDYQDGAAFGEAAKKAASSIMRRFDEKGLPNYSDNPKEARLAPSARGELLQKGKQFITQDKDAAYSANLAKTNVTAHLSQDEEKAYEALANTKLKESVACDDGSCLKALKEESFDMSEGLTKFAALIDSAKDIRASGTKNAHANILFKGKNYTCRIRHLPDEPINFCKRDKYVFLKGSNEEKALYQARKDNLAKQVSGDNYCSKRKKVRFRKKKRCVQKKQSWCVYPSRLAYLIQIEAHRQLGFGFGQVYGDNNDANCRGLSAYELSKINFDAPQMKNALSELFQSYRQKIQAPQSRPDSTHLKGNARDVKKSVEDALNLEKDYV